MMKMRKRNNLILRKTKEKEKETTIRQKMKLSRKA